MNVGLNGAGHGLKVLKFGGTSVGAPERLRRVAEIVADAARDHAVVVVASAASGVTDRLVAGWEAAGNGALDPSDVVGAVEERYRALAAEALPADRAAAYAAVLEGGLDRLGALLERIAADPAPPHRDALLAFGEALSVPLVAGVLAEAGLDAAPHDATALVRTDAAHGEANVDLRATFRLVRAWHAALPGGSLPVVAGFIGSTGAGATTTLGRGGSDYTAALFASALRASVLERWTDVDGVYTDDPRKNPEARRLASIVLEEAWAWNQAGKLGMHRKALDPLVATGTPVHVRCTATPDLPGTLILPK